MANVRYTEKKQQSSAIDYDQCFLLLMCSKGLTYAFHV